jgi:sporulation protein YlmC with PRC-barrel domain
MPDQAEIMEWRGCEVVDQDGDKVGKLDEIYVDRDTGKPEWAVINTGLFGRKSSFVPLKDALRDGEMIRVPYQKDHIKEAPNVDPDGEISPDEEQRVYAHYGLEYSQARSESGLPEGAGTSAPGQSDAASGPGSASGEAGTTGGGPGTTAGAPGTAGGGPGTSAGGPGTTAGESGTTGGGPGTTAGAPGTASAGPGTTAGEFGTAGGGPGTSASESGTATGGPGTSAGGPDTTAGESGTTGGGADTSATGSDTAAGGPGTSTGGPGTASAGERQASETRGGDVVPTASSGEVQPTGTGQQPGSRSGLRLQRMVREDVRLGDDDEVVERRMVQEERLTDEGEGER